MPTTTARLPGATPARRTAWYGVVSASATIDTSARSSPAAASRCSSTAHSPRPGTTMCEAKPPWMSLPGIFWARQIGGQAAPAQVAFAAGQHGRHDHRLAEPALGTGAGGDYMAADLVAQRQRQRRIGAHAVVVVAQVGVADAAAGDPRPRLLRPPAPRRSGPAPAARWARSSASGRRRCSWRDLLFDGGGQSVRACRRRPDRSV